MLSWSEPRLCSLYLCLPLKIANRCSSYLPHLVTKEMQLPTSVNELSARLLVVPRCSVCAAGWAAHVAVTPPASKATATPENGVVAGTDVGWNTTVGIAVNPGENVIVVEQAANPTEI